MEQCDRCKLSLRGTTDPSGSRDVRCNMIILTSVLAQSHYLGGRGGTVDETGVTHYYGCGMIDLTECMVAGLP